MEIFLKNNFLVFLITHTLFLSFITGKNEVTLEFHQHDDSEVSLMEMRFYVPPNNDGTDADPVKVSGLWYAQLVVTIEEILTIAIVLR